MINLHQRSKLIEMNHLCHSWEGTGLFWVRGKPSPRLPTPRPRTRPPPPAEANSGLLRLKLTMQLVNIYLKTMLRSKPRLRWCSDIFILVSDSLTSLCRATPWTCSHPKISWNNLQDFGCSRLHRDSGSMKCRGVPNYSDIGNNSLSNIPKALQHWKQEFSSFIIREEPVYMALSPDYESSIYQTVALFLFFQLGTLLYYIQTLKSVLALSKAMLPSAPAKILEHFIHGRESCHHLLSIVIIHKRTPQRFECTIWSLFQLLPFCYKSRVCDKIKPESYQCSAINIHIF